MEQTPGPAGPERTGFLTDADEMSLAESRERLGPDSVPDDLDVHGDAMSLVQQAIEPWRRPMWLAVAGVAIAAATLVGGALATRYYRQPR